MNTSSFRHVLLVSCSLAVVGLAGCIGTTNLGLTASAEQDFVAAEAGFDGAVNTADAIVLTGILPAATDLKLKNAIDSGAAAIRAGRAAVAAANATTIQAETAALTSFTAQISALTKGTPPS